MEKGRVRNEMPMMCTLRNINKGRRQMDLKETGKGNQK